MHWETFYLVCFALGLVLSVLSFAGGFHHHLHFPWHHAPHHTSGSSASHRGVSAVNGSTLTAFLCWFGGTGYLLQRYSGFAMPIVLSFAVVSGLSGGSLIFWFLASVLAPHDRALTAEDTEMTGVIGRVTGTIRAGGTGEVMYSQNGARRASPARSETGNAIARNLEVVVMRYERGIAYVRPWDEVSRGASLSTPHA